MNKTLKLSMIALLAILSTGVKAQEASETANGTARVKLRKALAIEEKTEMDFATVTLGTGAGTVSVGENGSLTPSGDYTTAGPGSAGEFTITGPASQVLNIDYTNGVLKSSASGATEIPVEITGDPSLTLTDTGIAELTVTGELSFEGNEPDGDYSTENGTPYTVTVSY